MGTTESKHGGSPQGKHVHNDDDDGPAAHAPGTVAVSTWNVLHRIHAENWKPKEEPLRTWPDESARIGQVVELALRHVKRRSPCVLALQEVSGDVLSLLLSRSGKDIRVFSHALPRCPAYKQQTENQPRFLNPREYLVTLVHGLQSFWTTAGTYASDAGKSFLAVSVTSRAGPQVRVVVFNTHVSWGERGEAQLETLLLAQKLCTGAGRFANCAALLAGDFNCPVDKLPASLRSAAKQFAVLAAPSTYTRPASRQNIDHIISLNSGTTLSQGTVLPVRSLSDHNLVTCNVGGVSPRAAHPPDLLDRAGMWLFPAHSWNVDTLSWLPTVGPSASDSENKSHGDGVVAAACSDGGGAVRAVAGGSGVGGDGPGAGDRGGDGGDGPRGVQLTVLTWNIWFDRNNASLRMAEIGRIIAKHSPDVIALQEVTPWINELLLAQQWAKEYYVSDPSGSELAGYGVMLLSKLPFVSLALRDYPGRMGRKALVGTVRVPGLASGSNLLGLSTFHLESYDHDFPVRAEQLTLLSRLLSASPAHEPPSQCTTHLDHVLVMGDTNFTQENEDRPLTAVGLVDTWPALYHGTPEETKAQPGLTFNSARLYKRIDRVYHSAASMRPLWQRLVGKEAFQPGLYPSDHLGVLSAFLLFDKQG